MAQGISPPALGSLKGCLVNITCLPAFAVLIRARHRFVKAKDDEDLNRIIAQEDYADRKQVNEPADADRVPAQEDCHKEDG